MASVIKMFPNFKRSHHPGGGGAGEKRSSSSISETAKGGGGGGSGGAGEETENCFPQDLLNRRKVSISKSGRYKENHRKRSALPDGTKRDPEAPVTPSTTPTKLSTSSKDDQRTLVSVKDKEEKNKENEKNRENILVRRDSIISDTDGHAVADEIESLAKTLTIQHALETAL